jgi:hypothetical protein
MRVQGIREMCYYMDPAPGQDNDCGSRLVSADAVERRLVAYFAGVKITDAM